MDLLLKKLEKYLKTDVRYLLNGGLWLSFGQGFALLSGLLLTVIMTNILSKEEYGMYQFIVSAFAIIGTFTLSKIGSVIVREIAQGKDSAFYSGFYTQLKWSVGIVIASIGVAGYYWINGNVPLAYTFLVIGLVVPLHSAFQLANSYLLGKQLFKESVLMGLWRKPIPVIALLIALTQTQNPLILAFFYFASTAVTSGLIYLLVLKKYNPPRLPEVNLVGLSKHLSFIAVIQAIGNNLDKLLVFYFLGPVVVAAYALAYVPIKILEGLFSSLYSMSLPKISQKDYAVLQNILPTKVRTTYYITLGIVATYILTVPILFKIIFPAYPEAIPYSQALALLLLSKPKGFYITAFLVHDMKKNIYLTSLSLPILTIALMLILVPMYGVWGAISASLVAHLLVNMIIIYLFKQTKPSTDSLSELPPEK